MNTNSTLYWGGGGENKSIFKTHAHQSPRELCRGPAGGAKLSWGGRLSSLGSKFHPSLAGGEVARFGTPAGGPTEQRASRAGGAELVPHKRACRAGVGRLKADLERSFPRFQDDASLTFLHVFLHVTKVCGVPVVAGGV